LIPSAVRIFVCTERQDVRRSFDALALVVRLTLALDPETGALFVFASKRSNRLKVLWFDQNGYCIVYKRLHDALFERIDHHKQRERRSGDREAPRRARETILGRRARAPNRGPRALSLGVLSLVLGERQLAELDAALAAANADQEVKGHTRRKPTGRKPLPEHLPRVGILVLPPEVEKQGLDAFERIGEDVSETIERRPASFAVARIIRPKFVRKDRERDAETDLEDM